MQCLQPTCRNTLQCRSKASVLAAMVFADGESPDSASDVRAIPYELVYAAANVDGEQHDWLRATGAPVVPEDVRAVRAAHVCAVANLDDEQRALGGGPTWAAEEVASVESVDTGTCHRCCSQNRWPGCECQRALK